MFKHALFTFVLLILFSISVASAKSISDNLKYLDSVSISIHDIEKYKSIQYLFHSFIKYDNEAYPPPFPYKGGRVRDGKYKASETALNEYIKNLSKYNNKIFTLAHVDYSANTVKGVVMACENGDSLYVGISTIRQFINKEYFDEIHKLIGTEIYYCVPHSNYSTVFGDNCPKNNCSDEEFIFPKQYPYFVGFTDVKTKKTLFYLPYLSTWKIVDIVFDTTFVGMQSPFSNRANLFFNRIRLTIKNEKYGEYYYFEDNLEPIARRNENLVIMERSNTCEEPIRHGNGDWWKQECSGYYRYWPNPSIFFKGVVTTLRDCHSFFPRHDNLCLDSTAFYLSKSSQIEKNINSYSDEELKTINEWASKGFVEALWTKILLNPDSLEEDVFMNLVLEGYPPIIAFLILDYKREPFPIQYLIDGMKKAYKTYGSQQVLDVMMDQLFELSQIYPSTEDELRKKFYEKSVELEYDSILAKFYNNDGKIGYDSFNANGLILERLFEESQIPTIKFDEFYKTAVEMGYHPVKAKEITSEYNKMKKETESQRKKNSIINAFKETFTEKYIFSTTFDQNLKQIQEFESKHNFKKKDLEEIVDYIICTRALPLHLQANKSPNPLDDLPATEFELKLYKQAISYGYQFNVIEALKIGAAEMKLENTIDAEIEKGSAPKNVFITIQHASPKLHKSIVNQMYEKTISKIIDKQKIDNKDSLTKEISVLEKEIELYQLAAKYGYKDGLDSIKTKQKRLKGLNRLKNVEHYYKSGK